METSVSFVPLWLDSRLAGKKSGAKIVTLHQSRPRLPGSVVGECSMASRWKSDKVTKGRRPS